MAQETHVAAAPKLANKMPATAQETSVAAASELASITPPAAARELQVAAAPELANKTPPPPPAQELTNKTPLPPAQELQVASTPELTNKTPPLAAAPAQGTPAPLRLAAQETPVATIPIKTPSPPLAQETPVAAPLIPAIKASAQETAPPPQAKKWLPRVKTVLGLLSKDGTLLNHGIYTVPNCLKSSTNDDALSPRIVSIGPFHRGKPGLLAMHEQKLIYLSFLLHRTPDPVQIFDQCCDSIFSSHHFKIYAENVGFSPSSASPDRDHDKLVEIMLIDACFIIELLLRSWEPSLLGSDDDPIFKNNWIISTLQHDLLLLENQIPFFILKIVFKNVRHNFSSDNLKNVQRLEILARQFFKACLVKEVPSMSRKSRPLHFLDMLHQAYVLPDYPLHYHVGHHTGDKEIDPVLKSSTQQLLAAGVNIEITRNHLLDISFENQTLKIPPLRIDRKTWSILKNLVVLEQCSVDRSHHVTSYVVVLRNLIRSKRDIELLEERGILVKDLGGGYDSVLAFVECVGSGVVIREFLYGKLFKDLNEFEVPWWWWRKREASWKLGWHSSIMVLRTDYFSNRWWGVQFAAAALLLMLTGLQTYYTVLSYF